MSFIADFLGGAAGAGGAIINRQIESDHQLERQKSLAEFNHEADLKKQVMMEQLRETRMQAADQIKAEREQAQITRDAKGYEAISSKAEAEKPDRVFADFKAKLGKTDMPEADMRKAFDENYYGKDIQTPTGGASYIESESKTRRAVLDNALKSGAVGGGIIKQAGTDYREALSSEKSAAELARKEKRDDSKATTDATRADASMTMANAALARASAAGNKDDKPEKVMTFIEGQRKAINSEWTELNALMSSETKSALGPDEKAAVKKQYQPQLDMLSKKRDQLNSDFNALRSNFGLPPVKEDAPKPAKADTGSAMPKTQKELVSGTTYQTSRGPAKWNGTAFESVK